jgi:putative redox protein
MKPPVTYDLEWQGDLRFSGRTGGISMVLDSDGEAGPSPMQAVAFGLAGCMSMDLADILVRGRHPLQGLRARLVAYRADAVPARFVKFELHFVATGAVPADAVARAIALSREKYCSVWHSLRPDIELTVTFDA